MSDKKEKTEKVGIQYGYVFDGKIYDLVPDTSDEVRFETLTEHADHLAKLLSITLGSILFELNVSSAKEDADEYSKYIIGAIDNASKNRAKELTEKFNAHLSEVIKARNSKNGVDVADEIGKEPENGNNSDTKDESEFTA